MARQHIVCVLALVAALVAATLANPAQAQRLSLAERVTLLENQANAENRSAGQANLEAQNRITQLQAEVSGLRNQIETLTHEIEQLKQRNRDQYVDLDSRLQRLEGGAPAAATPNSPAAATPAAPAEPAPAPAAAQSATAESAPDASAPADPAAEETAYQAALDALVERFEADQSARLFQAFIRDYPASALVPNAWYWLGESYYVTQNYDLALEAFQALLDREPARVARDDAAAQLAQPKTAPAQH